jgi:DNA adenine methylase
MISPSPLRYPGGKTSMANLLSQIRSINHVGSIPIAEPFAGGAGASLKLLFLEDTQDTPEIYINDKDNAIYNFWWSLINSNQEFLNRISGKRVSMTEYFRQRDIYRNFATASRLDHGFATFFLNRCNRSGIILNGGPIGGPKQKGEWKLNARFNKVELKERCLKIFEYSDRINLSNQDGIEFIQQTVQNSPFYFIDPPYFTKGPLLYLNLLDKNYHQNLSLTLNSMTDKPWVLTYDDCPEIRKLYKGWTKIKPFSLRYSAADRRKGQEIMIIPKWMTLPKVQTSEAIGW